MMTTTFELPGFRVVKNLGEVRGIVEVRETHTHIFLLRG